MLWPSSEFLLAFSGDLELAAETDSSDNSVLKELDLATSSIISGFFWGVFVGLVKFRALYQIFLFLGGIRGLIPVLSLSFGVIGVKADIFLSNFWGSDSSVFVCYEASSDSCNRFCAYLSSLFLWASLRASIVMGANYFISMFMSFSPFAISPNFSYNVTALSFIAEE